MNKYFWAWNCVYNRTHLFFFVLLILEYLESWNIHAFSFLFLGGLETIQLL